METQNILPLEIWQRIHDNLDFKSKCFVMLTCKYFRYSLIIAEIDDKYLNKLNDNVLTFSIFKRIKRLKIKRNIWYEEITQKGIEELNLVELSVRNFRKITSVF